MLDHIDVVSVQFLAVLWAAVGFLALVGVRAVRRSRRRPVRIGALAALALVVSAVAAADTVNAHYAFLPTVGDVRQSLTGDRQWLNANEIESLAPAQHNRAVRNGAIVRFTIPPDQADGFGRTRAVAYLPPQYFRDASARFPVIYLFHGSPGRPADWFHGGRAARVASELAKSGHPAIVFAPQLSRSWTDDPECVDGSKERVESHLLKVVIPFADSVLRTVADRAHRVFAGMSAGGYCALNLGLRHRSLVSTIVDMSGETRPTHTGGSDELFGERNPLRTQLVAANSPAVYAATLGAGPPTRVWLDAGLQDTGIVAQLRTVAEALRARGIEVMWRVRPGGHTYRVWTSALREALPWAIDAPQTETRSTSHPGP